MPQWQGGNLTEYHLSSQLLSWLLPPTDGAEVTVAIPSPGARELKVEDGIVAKTALLSQARAARIALEAQKPDRVLTIGGDCLVDLAPIAYLNRRYGGDIGVIWIDAHPDVQTPAVWPHAHAHVLGMLLGEGDIDFVREVGQRIQPSKVMHVGLDKWSPVEDEVISRLGLERTSSDELANGSERVLAWIKSEHIQRVAVHLDLDAIHPRSFRPILFNDPQAGMDFLKDVPRGQLKPDQIVALLEDVGEASDIVGLAIAEFISWDALQMRSLLEKLPLIRE